MYKHYYNSKKAIGNVKPDKVSELALFSNFVLHWSCNSVTKALRECYCLCVHPLAGEKGANVHLYTFDEGQMSTPLDELGGICPYMPFLGRGQMSKGAHVRPPLTSGHQRRNVIINLHEVMFRSQQLHPFQYSYILMYLSYL